ncbi:hypothetical protein Q9R20_14575 [Microbacterium sp. PRF11]|uniref:hypothetical protein n=1 Tax=Microbacterium sp. PRF11 TaxID=2962593 RepID=UPI002881C297|nr:hypothetical protein [Microbacterium sp. PRF11]MDT0118205.1 hypothetical protein [Microbacterium sp. PRF11]
MLAALATLIAIGRLVGEPPGVLEDEEAARFADHSLVTAISTAAAVPGSTDAVKTALQQGVIAGRANESPYEWTFLSATDVSVSVAVYYHWGEGGLMFPATRPAWGRACRTYDLGTRPVTAHPIECPEDAQDRPRG